MRRFTLNKIVLLLSTAGIVSSLSTPLHAAAFQIWEQDAASIGNYHSGYAAEINDASTAFYNPAGITRFKNQQIVFGGDAVITSIKYQGTIGVDTIFNGSPVAATGQGGNFNFVPFVHYVTPLTNWMGFGFSVDVPFGLKTTWGRNSNIQYAATTTASTVVDISPALGFQVTDKGSFGIGLDIQRMDSEFDSSGGIGFPTVTADSVNKVSDTGYGGHAGVLYQFSENSRVGLSYHSQVVHHLNGSSQLSGPLAALAGPGQNTSSQIYTNMTLPPYTALSVYHKVHPKVALLATAIFTQWNIFRALILNGVTGVNDDADLDKHLQVTVLQYYRNVWNLAVGADYYATDKITLKAGVGYDQSPVSTAYRTIQLPDNNRVAVACGGHYQASQSIGVDLGWQHLFVHNAPIRPNPQVIGGMTVTSNGTVNSGADIFAGSITWDIT